MAISNNSRKKKTMVMHGVVHIRSYFNNIIVTITDKRGNTLIWVTAGSCGFKGSRKSTPFAAQVVADRAGKKAQEMGMDRY